MPKLLEELQNGTPVCDNRGSRVGEVRAVYASGEALGVEYVLVYWTARGEEALIPADEVMHVGDDGVTLRLSADSYADRPAFNPKANPLLRPL